MRWQRGFFRVWAVLSLLWVSYMVIRAFQAISEFEDYRYNIIKVPPEPRHIWEIAEVFIGFAILPPTAAFAVGLVVAWVARGFKP